MHELVINLHMHTPYSDGSGSHAEIVQAALRAGLDVVIVTDHNVLVSKPEGYYQDGNQRVLLLTGEEIHDQTREPQKNHLLVFGVGHELSMLAPETQRLIDNVRQEGGVAFLAHPVDPAAPALNQDDISWVDWEIKGYHGIELWNAMSEFKSLLRTKLHAIYYAFNPRQVARGPFSETLSKWDELLCGGQHVAAIGGSDAHAILARLGPLHRTLFTYEFHFKSINTHLLTPSPLTGDLIADRRMILDALAIGRAYIGYDLPASTGGFHFTAQGSEGTAWMGENVISNKGVTLQIRLPRPTECRLVKDGKVIKSWNKRETCIYITNEPGVYRVEAFIHYQGRWRGWIFSNPIYIVLK